MQPDVLCGGSKREEKKDSEENDADCEFLQIIYNGLLLCVQHIIVVLIKYEMTELGMNVMFNRVVVE